ncbi:hypothetical protein [Stenotrophomonas oahuensis]|uniref:Lysozyme inhibitor LprI N-terminal domain-containing protein n=1 Tax=Stenotrophomonas oahuensis TaxID=3003271 RepID=A0ABY9YTP7_9GAMM|nr:hypothetical protein [Stenotrophomonas sp. A5586]WNH54343.1 hypothetical protein PDM29_08710 [Stenotrophomonas sp. A5586]
MMEKPARQPSVIKLTPIPYNRLSAAVGTVADRAWKPYRRAVTNRCAEWMLNYRRAPRQGQALRREKRNVNLNTSNPAMSAAACCAALLALCLGLVAAHPAAAAPQTSSAPAAETISDEDMDPGLDDSYNVADFRPQYGACIEASDAVMPEIKDCQDEEFSFQEARLRAALARINAGPDGYFKDEVGNWQAEYMRYTNINCGDKEKNGPVGEGLSCFMNRYANRANALEALADMAEKVYGKGR